VITLSHTNSVFFVMETQRAILEVVTVAMLWVVVFWTFNCTGVLISP